jgi:hypothetical protein
MADPIDKETAALQQQINLLKIKNQLSNTEKELATKINSLVEDKSLTTQQIADLEKNIAVQLKAHNTALLEQDKITAKIERNIELMDKPFQRLLENSEKINKVSEGISNTFNKIPQGLRNVSAEMVAMGATALKNTQEYLKTISDPSSSPSTVFGQTSKYFYQNYATAARDTIRLQKEFRKDLEISKADYGMAAKNTAFTGIDINLAAQAEANIRVQTEAQGKMAYSVTTLARKLGLSRDEAANLTDSLQTLGNLDVVNPQTRKDIVDTTTNFVNLRKLGVLPANITLEELTNQSKKFGIGTSADLARVSREYVAISYLPGKLKDAQGDASSATSQFLAKNAQDLSKHASAFAASVATQNSSISGLAASYTMLTAQVAKYGASAESANSIAATLIGGIAARGKTTDVNGIEALVAADLGSKSKAEMEAIVDDILKNKSYSKDAQGKAAREFDKKQLIEGVSSNAYEGGYVLKTILDTPTIQKLYTKKLVQTSGSSNNTRIVAMALSRQGIVAANASDQLRLAQVAIDMANGVPGADAAFSQLLRGANAAAAKGSKEEKQREALGVAVGSDGKPRSADPTQDTLALALGSLENDLGINKWGLGAGSLLVSLGGAQSKQMIAQRAAAKLAEAASRSATLSRMVNQATSATASVTSTAANAANAANDANNAGRAWLEISDDLSVEERALFGLKPTGTPSGTPTIPPTGTPTIPPTGTPPPLSRISRVNVGLRNFNKNLVDKIPKVKIPKAGSIGTALGAGASLYLERDRLKAASEEGKALLAGEVATDIALSRIGGALGVAAVTALLAGGTVATGGLLAPALLLAGGVAGSMTPELLSRAGVSISKSIGSKSQAEKDILDNATIANTVTGLVESIFAPNVDDAKAKLEKNIGDPLLSKSAAAPSRGSVYAMATSRSMTVNPDGSSNFDFTLVIPGFAPAVYQAMADGGQLKPQAS